MPPPTSPTAPLLGHFGDARRRRVGIDLLARLMAVGPAGGSVRYLGGKRAGEIRFGRFLANPKVTAAEMLATAAASTRALTPGRHILAIQDTTGLRDDGERVSLNLHPTIAMDATNGALLGLIAAVLLPRDGSAAAVHCNKRAFREKESYRWLASEEAAATLLAAGAASVTVVGDREGDIYEDFALRPPGVEVLFRAHHNRKLADGGSLFSRPAAWAELGRETITIPPASGRRERTAVLAVRAGAVTLARPKRNRAAEAAKLPAAVTVHLVEAREVDPPAKEKPVVWRLLTTHPVGGLAAALRITSYYRRRWTIEQLFRTIKTKGFDVEASRVGSGGRFEKLALATLIAGIAVLSLVQARDGAEGRALSEVFPAADATLIAAIGARQEGRTARQQNPHPPGSLAHASWVCARLGGWGGYYGKPGPVVMLRGLLRLEAMMEGMRMASEGRGVGPEGLCCQRNETRILRVGDRQEGDV